MQGVLRRIATCQAQVEEGGCPDLKAQLVRKGRLGTARKLRRLKGIKGHKR